MRKKMRKIIFILIIFVFVIKFGFGQTYDWYPHKPNTTADSISIIKNKIRSCRMIYGVVGDTTTFCNDTIMFYYSNDKIDSTVFKNGFAYYLTERKYLKDKILETVKMKPGYGKDSFTVFKRTHHINNLKQITKTDNRLIKGIPLEGESFSKIVYIYQNNVLTEEHLFDATLTKDFYYYIKFNYEYY